MKEHDLGIFIHRIPFSESSAVVSYYTARHGFQKYLFLGAKKKNNQLFPLNIQELDFYKRNDSELGKLTQAISTMDVTEIPFDPVKSSLAYFIAEILQKCLSQSEKDPHLFQFLHTTITELDSGNNLSNIALHFLMDLTEYLGIQPQITSDKPISFHLVDGDFSAVYTNEPNAEGKLMTQLLSLLKKEEIKPTKEERKLILDTLLIYYTLHIDNFGKLTTREILSSIFQ
ncbi:MAG: DNA repair protein RecO (recombination protein O) [Psychromonas sp.]|jgi:DNA repair protein RecO (recombination protein O)